MYDDLQTLATACFQKFIFLIKMLPPNILKNELPTSVCVCVCVCVCACAYAQSCPALCDPMDWRPPGSSVHGISQTRIKCEQPYPFPGYLPDPGTKLTSPESTALADGFFTTEPPGKPL